MTNERVEVTLFPADYETIEMVTEAGDEILQQEPSEAQLFMHSIQELERVRFERIKTNAKKRKIIHRTEREPQIDTIEMNGNDKSMEQTQDVDETMSSEETTTATDDMEIIDPRIHYRPVVAELQASIVELNQLINTIDLIRRRDFLQDLQCMRENTLEKKDELENILVSKTHQLEASNQILLHGVEALTATVEKERHFFEGVTHVLHQWKVCAPLHGHIPKPFRAGEPLAVDCSFASAGSTFTPTRTIADLAFAELGRTDKGLVCIKTPEEYMARTVQVELHCLVTDAKGIFTLPSPQLFTISRSTLDQLNNTPEDLEQLDKRNRSVLESVQFSVFCEELFYTVMKEALWNSNHGHESTVGSNKRPVYDIGAVVLEVLDDKIRLRLLDQFDLTVRLLASSSDTIMISSNGLKGTELYSSQTHQAFSTSQFLTQTCRLTLVLLQQEIRNRYVRSELTKGLMFASDLSGTNSSGTTGAFSSQSAPAGVPVDPSSSSSMDSVNSCILATVVRVIAHNLLKNQVSEYIDDLSMRLAAQNFQDSGACRILDDGLSSSQPICDSVRGIYVSPRWKVCPHDSTLSAFDLTIGKIFYTEVVIAGNKIRFEEGSRTIREVTTLSSFHHFMEKAICSQVTNCLYQDLHSFGFTDATMDLHRSSVRLFAAGEWNGSCIGDGRVPDTKPTTCIYFAPQLSSDMQVRIHCTAQSMDLSMIPSDLISDKSCNNITRNDRLVEIEWYRIPGQSDTAKMVWLLERVTKLPPFLTRSKNIPKLD